MNPLHEIDPDHAPRRAGWKTAAAVVIVGVIVALADRSIRPATDAPLAPAAAEVRADDAFDYFPSGHTLQAGEPEAHIEAF